MAQEMSADQVTPDVVIEQMPQHLDTAKAGATNATMQFDLSGDNGGKWWIKIHDGTAEAGKGEVENPNLTLLAAADDYVKIALGPDGRHRRLHAGQAQDQGRHGTGDQVPVPLQEAGLSRSEEAARTSAL